MIEVVLSIILKDTEKVKVGKIEIEEKGLQKEKVEVINIIVII